MNDKKEPDFIQFEAPDTDLNDVEFNIEPDAEIPEFETESFEFDVPETIPEFTPEESDEPIFEIENEVVNTKTNITTIEKNLADEFINTTENSPDFKIPENLQNDETFEIATKELETKINHNTKETKTSFLNKFNIKNLFKNKDWFKNKKSYNANVKIK